MKTIILTSTDKTKQLNTCISRIEKYTDHAIKNAVVCTKYIDKDNYYSVTGELHDAERLDDFDVFIVACTCPDIITGESIAAAAKIKSYVICSPDEIETAKNFIVLS